MLEFFRSIINVGFGYMNDPFKLTKVYSGAVKVYIYNMRECYYKQFIIDGIINTYNIDMLKQLIDNVLLDEEGIHIV